MADKNHLPCANCGTVHHIDALDGKPESLAGKPAAEWDLAEAADRGEDFIVLECKDCYGPAYLPA